MADKGCEFGQILKTYTEGEFKNVNTRIAVSEKDIEAAFACIDDINKFVRGILVSAIIMLTTTLINVAFNIFMKLK